MKSTPEEIRARFDADVERFSNLETGQAATVDARLVMELLSEAAAATTPSATRVLDVGCGAGNYSLMLLRHLPNLNFTLLDLSKPMLDRAHERLSAQTAGAIELLQGDIREVKLQAGKFNIILATAVLHHLRGDEEWREVFQKFYDALRPGGAIWIFDLVESTLPAVETLMWRRYGEYLTSLKDGEYCDHVFAYIEKEDTQRSLMFQIDLLREVGFDAVEVLHKNSCFAAFGAVKN